MGGVRVVVADELDRARPRLIHLDGVLPVVCVSNARYFVFNLLLTSGYRDAPHPRSADVVPARGRQNPWQPYSSTLHCGRARL